MRKIHIVFDFIRCPYAMKIVKGRNVFEKMTDNPNFPNPDVALSLLKSATDTVETWYLASINRDTVASARLRKEVLIWNDIMRYLAKYVERMANNDVAILLSSGFNLAKPTIPGPRAEFSAKNGEVPGSVVLRRKALENGYAYIWQLCINVFAENDKEWTLADITVQASIELKGLNSATRYWFRCAVVTPKGITAYCNPIMVVVK